MKMKYELNDMGQVHYILGIKVTRNSHEGIMIDQHTYIKQKLKMFNMNECKEASVPGDINVMLNDSNESSDINQYRSIVGSLIYASMTTRPDITHAVNITARYMHNPTTTHMRAALKILRYLSGTTDFGIRYIMNNDNTNELIITGYCDADWGGDKNDRKSTTGYCVFINNNLISWNTKKQPTVALSTAEAELMAIVEVVKEVKWMSAVLHELKFIVKKPMIIYSDNQAAGKMAQHDVDHERTKHIDIRHHFIRDEINNNEVIVKWIRTEQQIADIFTKMLHSPRFVSLRDRLVSDKNKQS